MTETPTREATAFATYLDAFNAGWTLVTAANSRPVHASGAADGRALSARLSDGVLSDVVFLTDEPGRDGGRLGRFAELFPPAIATEVQV